MPPQLTRRDVMKGFGIATMTSLLSPSVFTEAAAAPAHLGRLPRVTPEEVGISPEAVSAFIDAVNEHVGGLHSFMLLRHGRVAAEGWWAPYAPQLPHMLYSLSKSFTSTAVGLV